MMLGFPPLPTTEEIERAAEAGRFAAKVIGQIKRDFPDCIAEPAPSIEEFYERAELARLKAKYELEKDNEA